MHEILCLGSSLVAGILGANWISKLNNQRNISDKFKLLNYGINGAQVPTLLKQLTTLPSTLSPSAVILMIGVNDAIACSDGLKDSPVYSKYAFERHGRPASLPQFEIDLKELIQELQERFKNIPIGVFDIKNAGDEIMGPLNDNIRQFNEVIYKIVRENPARLHQLKLYEPGVSLSAKAKDHLQVTTAGGSTSLHHVVDPSRMITVFLYHTISFGAWSYNSLGDARGCYSTCDGIHFNERSAEIVMNEVTSFLGSLSL